MKGSMETHFKIDFSHEYEDRVRREVLIMIDILKTQGHVMIEAIQVVDIGMRNKRLTCKLEMVIEI